MSAARSNGPLRYYPDHLREEAARLRALATDAADGDDDASAVAAKALEAAARELERAAQRIERAAGNV